ncbi:endo alpha-1,4 polygalactosaminidase [Arthrobacter sp. NamB2]|nr:endo alpha-1,4 polygalactosaminidase [Arthrobacter sp. NamB2]
MFSALAVLVAGCSSPAQVFPGGAQFDYQLGGGYEPPEGVSVVVRDATDDPAVGMYSICYLNAFQTQPQAAESWRAAGLLLEVDGRPLADPDWPDEYLLDTGSASTREAIAARIAQDILQCAKNGFDAVELDNLDSYGRSNGQLTFEDNLEVAKMLVKQAHDLGLLVGQKNAAEESSRLRDIGFDFAVAEQCVEFDECSTYTIAYGADVLAIEYLEGFGSDDPCETPDRPTSTIVRDLNLTMPDDPAYRYMAC